MMKILYVGGATASEKGAVGTHTSGIISALKKRPDVDLYGVFYREAIPGEIPKSTELYEKPAIFSIFGKAGKLLALLSYCVFLKKHLARIGADYLYVRFDPFFCFLLSFFIDDHKIIVEYNDLFMDQIEYSAARGQWGDGWSKKIRLSKIYKKFVINSERKCFRSARLVVAVTEELLRYCMSFGVDVNGVVIKNATSLKFLDPASSKVSSNTALMLAHVGTLTYWDGLVELVRAIHLAFGKDSDFRCQLTIVGEGKMKGDLQELVEELGLQKIVLFVGAKPRSEAVEHLRTCDVVPILKTITGYGLSPMKFYEAMGAGCHVLATDVPHMNEDDPRCVTNVSFPLDINEIADALIEFHNVLPEIRERRNEVANYALQNHSWETRIDTLIEGLRAVS